VGGAYNSWVFGVLSDSFSALMLTAARCQPGQMALLTIAESLATGTLSPLHAYIWLTENPQRAASNSYRWQRDSP
jgi:hypothetical protein